MEKSYKMQQTTGMSSFIRNLRCRDYHFHTKKIEINFAILNINQLLFHFPGTFMLFKSTSAFKKQSVKPKKSGLENPLDSFLGRNSILDDKYEDTVSQK